jgi:hypothetical protein
MTRTDLSSLSPSDAQVALRSLPRRYREAFEGEKRRARADVVGGDGMSALDLLENTVGTLALLERAVDLIDHREQPVLHRGVLDPTEREFATPGASVDGLLDDLDREANAFADRVGAMAAGSWSRIGTVTARDADPAIGRTVTALAVVQEAVASSTDNLRTVDRLLSGG